MSEVPEMRLAVVRVEHFSLYRGPWPWIHFTPRTGEMADDETGQILVVVPAFMDWLEELRTAFERPVILNDASRNASATATSQRPDNRLPRHRRRHGDRCSRPWPRRGTPRAHRHRKRRARPRRLPGRRHAGRRALLARAFVMLGSVVECGHQGPRKPQAKALEAASGFVDQKREKSRSLVEAWVASVSYGQVCRLYPSLRCIRRRRLVIMIAAVSRFAPGSETAPFSAGAIHPAFL